MSTFKESVALKPRSAGYRAKAFSLLLCYRLPKPDALCSVEFLPMSRVSYVFRVHHTLRSCIRTGCCVVGYGGISLAVEGPSKVDIQTEDLEDGTCKVSYFPTVPGVYIVSTKFADEHVPGMRLL